MALESIGQVFHRILFHMVLSDVFLIIRLGLWVFRKMTTKAKCHSHHIVSAVCVCLVAQSCLTLCDPMDCNLPDSSVHGILQARILEWIFSRGSSQPKDWTQVSNISGGILTIWATREAQEYWSGKPVPSPGDLPDPGIKPGSPALQVDSLPAELPGKPSVKGIYYQHDFLLLMLILITWLR